jgi:hypothetical protein
VRTEIRFPLDDGNVAVLQEDSDIAYPNTIRNYAILIPFGSEDDAVYVATYDQVRSEMPSSTYDRSASLWGQLLKRTRELQSEGIA